MAHALLKFCFQRIDTLDDAVRLIEENAAVLRQILKKRDGLRIKIMKILLRSLQNFALADLIADFLCRKRRLIAPHLGKSGEQIRVLHIELQLVQLVVRHAVCHLF